METFPELNRPIYVSKEERKLRCERQKLLDNKKRIKRNHFKKNKVKNNTNNDDELADSTINKKEQVVKMHTYENSIDNKINNNRYLPLKKESKKDTDEFDLDDTFLSVYENNDFLYDLEVSNVPWHKFTKFGDEFKENNKSSHSDWSQKPLEEMTLRDWSIMREDLDIIVKGGDIPNPARSWEEMNLLEDIYRNIKQAGYKTPSNIQKQAIPIGLTQRDFIGVAETGSGKTAAFVIPMLVFLSRVPREQLYSCVEDGPLATVLGPTRELVQQIDESILLLGKGLCFRSVVLVGGNSIQEQIHAINNGCHIVCATPGRLIDCLDNRYLVLNHCSYLVLDEADRMIDMGFQPQVELVLKNMKKIQQSDVNDQSIEEERFSNNFKNLSRTTIMFSATIPPSVEHLGRTFMHSPAIVRVGDESSCRNMRVKQEIYFVTGLQAKKKKLIFLLTITPPPIIVFANSKQNCDMVTSFLKDSTDFNIVSLHSGKVQAQREANLAGFKNGSYDVLVATDVAGRGIDIDNIMHVINFDMTIEIDRYIHRIGRTGRAGKYGLASTILTKEDESIFGDLVRYLKRIGVIISREVILGMNSHIKNFK